MRLSPEQLSAVWVALRSEPFNAGMETADAVERILKAGNDIHGEQDATFYSHLRHAMRHKQGGETDKDSGEPNAAHVAARVVLALITLCNERGER